MARTARRSGPSKSSRIPPEATAHQSGSRQSHPQLAPEAKTAQDPSRQPDLSTGVDTQCALHGQQASRGPCVARQSGGQIAEHLPHPDLIARPSWASFATARDAIRRRPSRRQEHFRNPGGLCGDRRARRTRIGKSPELSAPLACEDSRARTASTSASTRCRIAHRCPDHPLPGPTGPCSAEARSQPHGPHTIRQAAAVCGQRPRDFLRQTVVDAVARHKEECVRHLTTQWERLPAQHTPEELLLCAAGFLLSRHNRLPGGRSGSPGRAERVRSGRIGSPAWHCDLFR
jgi:hypothetical protein